MFDFVKIYNKDRNRILLQSRSELFHFINYLGGDLEIDKCSRGGVRYTLTTKSGIKDMYAGGFANTKKLFETFNELYDLDINVDLSGRVQSLYTVVFNKPPIQIINGEVYNYGQETESQADTQDCSQGTEQVSEVVDQEEQPTQPEESGSSEATEDGTRVGVTIEEPEWDKIKPPQWSKQRVKELAVSLDLVANTKIKFPEMVEGLQKQYESKYK